MSAAMLDGNAAAELAHDDQMAAHDENVEAAKAMFGEEARAELRDGAMEDADAIRDLLAELSDGELRQLALDAVADDAIATHRVIRRLIVNHITARENDETEIEHTALRMWKEAA